MDLINRLIEIQMLLVFVCVFGFLMGKGFMALTGKQLTFFQVIIVIFTTLLSALLISVGVQYINSIL